MDFGGFKKLTAIDYPGRLACMVYTIGCNFRCPYCHNPELVGETVETKIPEKDILFFLENRRTLLDAIVITGGEPTMHGENLLSFMRKVKKLSYFIKLDSNGTNPDFLEKAIAEKLVDYIAMDIKAPLYKYSQAVSRPVDTDAIEKSIQIIKTSGIEYEFRTTVVKSMLELEDFDIIGEEIKGANKYYLQKFVPTKILNPQLLNKVSYSDEALGLLCDRMKKYVKYCAIRS